MVGALCSVDEDTRKCVCGLAEFIARISKGYEEQMWEAAWSKDDRMWYWWNVLTKETQWDVWQVRTLVGLGQLCWVHAEILEVTFRQPKCATRRCASGSGYGDRSRSLLGEASMRSGGRFLHRAAGVEIGAGARL